MALIFYIVCGVDVCVPVVVDGVVVVIFVAINRVAVKFVVVCDVVADFVAKDDINIIVV